LFSRVFADFERSWAQKNIYKKEFSFREEFLGEEFKKNPCSAQQPSTHRKTKGKKSKRTLTVPNSLQTIEKPRGRN